MTPPLMRVEVPIVCSVCGETIVDERGERLIPEWTEFVDGDEMISACRRRCLMAALGRLAHGLDARGARRASSFMLGAKPS